MIPRRIALAMLAASFGVVLHAQTPVKSPLEGVWKVTDVQVTGGAGSMKTPQPGLYIFTRGYYSVLAINADRPRTVIPFQTAPATDKDKIALYDHWTDVTANAGTFTVKGSTLTTRPMVAKNEGVMQGPVQTREFKVEGSTLWLVLKDGPAGVGTETRTKLTRVE